MNLLIGTPAYNGLVHIDYMDSIIDMHRLKIPLVSMKIGNESLITRGRNTIISFFHNMKEFTHLFFLDADIKIKGEDVIKLMQYGVDVIGAPVPLKGYDKEGNKVYNVVNPIRSKFSSLYEVDKAGTAVMILSRKAVTYLIEIAQTYKGNEYTRGDVKIDTMYDVFKTGVENEVYLSEDFYVCKQLKQLGYKIFVDDTIITAHTGMYQF